MTGSDAAALPAKYVNAKKVPEATQARTPKHYTRDSQHARIASVSGP